MTETVASELISPEVEPMEAEKITPITRPTKPDRQIRFHEREKDVVGVVEFFPRGLLHNVEGRAGGRCRNRFSAAAKGFGHALRRRIARLLGQIDKRLAASPRKLR